MSNEKILPPPYEGIQVCSISFNMTDRIRLIGISSDIINSMRIAITKSWGPIQNERDYYKSHEFKLKGNPWHGDGQDAVRSRRLLVAVLRTMVQFGWNLLQAANVSKKQDNKDTLFFEKATPDPIADLFAISFNMTDRIRIIDAPSFYGCVKDAIQSHWRYRIQKERNYYGSMEFKLSGTPWDPEGSEAVYSRMLLCQIIANIRERGYKLYGSVDISIGFEGMDLDTWIFRRVDPAWQ